MCPISVGLPTPNEIGHIIPGWSLKDKFFMTQVFIFLDFPMEIDGFALKLAVLYFMASGLKNVQDARP